MKCLSTSYAEIGPFETITKNDDHYFCDSTIIPFSVVGECEITDYLQPDSPLQTKEQQNAPIFLALKELDMKSIRALREGNTDRIAELENQAIELRQKLVK